MLQAKALSRITETTAMSLRELTLVVESTYRQKMRTCTLCSLTRISSHLKPSNSQNKVLSRRRSKAYQALMNGE